MGEKPILPLAGEPRLIAVCDPEVVGPYRRRGDCVEVDVGNSRVTQAHIAEALRQLGQEHARMEQKAFDELAVRALFVQYPLGMTKRPMSVAGAVEGPRPDWADVAGADAIRRLEQLDAEKRTDTEAAAFAWAKFREAGAQHPHLTTWLAFLAGISAAREWAEK